MRLSTVFELLVIALLIAFAASRVIDGPAKTKSLTHRFAVRGERQNQDPPSRYCSCSSLTCNCCREFSLPIVPVKGPGCATVSYLHDDVMMITMSFGDRVLRNITVNSKKPRPICMGMPGGISKFCGRLYSIKREGENFKACLGLELRALDDVEAALRVSCFKFGPNGVNVEPGEAVPAEKSKEKEDEYDDDDDYGLGALDDDDDDDDFGLTGAADDDDDEEDDDDQSPAKDEAYNDVDSSDSDADGDYTGLSSLSEELFGGLFGSSTKKRKPVKHYNDEVVYAPDPPRAQSQQIQPQPTPQLNLVVMQPVILPTPTTKPHRQGANKRPANKPTKVSPTTPTPLKKITTAASVKRTKTTPSPVRTLAPSSTTPSVLATNSTAKPPKKKKPSRKRKPTTPKPAFKNSTEAAPTIVTATTLTVNVVQGGVNLNETKPQNVFKPEGEAPFKIPMSNPVIETKPMEPTGDSNEPLKTIVGQTDRIVAVTEKDNTETNEFTTQTIMHNTIPIDDSINDGIQSISDQLYVKSPIKDSNNEALMEDLIMIDTTPTEATVEFTTNSDETNKEYTSYTNNNFYNNPDRSDGSVTEKYSQTVDETTTAVTSSKPDQLKSDEIGTTSIEEDTTDNIATSSMNTATVRYAEEGTDKTMSLTAGQDDKQPPKKSGNESEEASDDDDDDNEEDEEDGDGVGIDLGSELGLEDDDDEGDEDENKKKPIDISPEEKDDDDDDDILGGLLDDDEDDDENKTKEKVNERALGHSNSYKINPLLYQLARVSSGSIATARHLPRFSEGRNRRNNKRMRFPSLEIMS